jgi:SpoVK/Ycf46/Vps4 family AAA+-type ATPase
LRGTFGEFYAPLDASIRAVWRGKGAPPDGKLVLDNQLIATAKRFINIRKCSDEEKQRYYEEICRRFNLEYAENVFPLPLQQSFNPQIQQKLDRAPVSISYLEEYDSRHGSNYADRARNALFQFANLVIKSDGTVTKDEEAELLHFKWSLYPPSAVARSRETQEAVVQSKQEVSAAEGALKETPTRAIEDLMKELDTLVGLERVKADVRQLINFIKVQQMREERGMAQLPISRHLVFYGNPGTGKTTIARLLAQVYRTLNILSKGHLVETDRAGLVAGHIGQTALKVKEVVGGALGGVLFIDEAYALSGESEQDFGHEAIETLLKLMEDHRHDLIVVVAGYTDRMEEFINSNPGLRSRFNKFIHFEDYDDAQLLQIFKGFCKKTDFKLTADAERALVEVFKTLMASRDETFGNARTARNLFEMTISKQANRIVSLANIDEAVLSTIEAADIPNAEDLKTSGIQAPAV